MENNKEAESDLNTPDNWAIHVIDDNLSNTTATYLNHAQEAHVHILHALRIDIKYFEQIQGCGIGPASGVIDYRYPV